MKTLALVIGNNDYLGKGKLDNAVNDAKAISEIFERLGYEVIYKPNCSSADCSDALTEFESRISTTDSSIFYFAGHGFQFEGENYLAAIDCPVENPNKNICERTCIRLTEILDIIKKAPTTVNIVIIDACRKSFSRGNSNVFSAINTPKGTIIAFSTSPNEAAKDTGMEEHSIYTGALLKYIGRELLSVEELFKKVRKTVSNLSGGTQTSWEHTSLIGDFYFNTGQLVYSISIPYDESVIKDRTYSTNDNVISNIIADLSSCNWNRQNPAIDKFLSLPVHKVDKNQQFIIGRNILQASTNAYNVGIFMENLSNNLSPYTTIDLENHLLNGILFEVYFNNNGDFRRDNCKKHCIDKIFSIRHNSQFEKSFEFIKKAILPYEDTIYYLPSPTDTIIDVDVLATQQTDKNRIGEDVEYQVIESINISSRDITSQMSRYGLFGTNKLNLQQSLSDFMIAPVELININSNIELNSIIFRKIIEENKAEPLPF